MILSQQQIEEIGASVTQDFTRFLNKNSLEERFKTRETPIDFLAKNYLGLHVSYARLSEDGSICGLTAYVDTEYEIEERGIRRTVQLKQNEIILDRSFLDYRNRQQLEGTRRFTLAHECAHQILFQLESDETRKTHIMGYAERKAFSLRDLKTREDWNEWQANALGAALLLPQIEVSQEMWKLKKGYPLISYEGIFAYHDRLCLSLFCHMFGVSKSAAKIRLRQLGYIIQKPRSEYIDPLEVWDETTCENC